MLFDNFNVVDQQFRNVKKVTQVLNKKFEKSF